MLAIVKTPRIDLRIRGTIPGELLQVLEQVYANKLKLINEESGEELVRVTDTPEYKAFKKKTKPGDYVRIYRENRGMTQAALGSKVGMTRAYICDMEKGRRAISKAMAKKMAGIFNTSVSRFI